MNVGISGPFKVMFKSLEFDSYSKYKEFANYGGVFIINSDFFCDYLKKPCLEIRPDLPLQVLIFRFEHYLFKRNLTNVE